MNTTLHRYLEYDLKNFRPIRLLNNHQKVNADKGSIEFEIININDNKSNVIMLIIGDLGQGAQIVDYELIDSTQSTVHLKFSNPYFMDAAENLVMKINAGDFADTEYAPFDNFEYNSRNYQITVLSL